LADGLSSGDEFGSAWLVALAANMALVGEDALAEEPAAATQVPSAEDIAKARAAFWEAHEQYTAGNYREAVALFEQSYSIYPQNEVLFNIALAHAKGGDCDTAHQTLRQYLRGREHGHRAGHQQRLELLLMARQNIRIDVSSLRGSDSHLTAYITGGRGARLTLSFARKLEEVLPAVWLSPNARGIRHVVGQLCETEMPDVIKRLRAHSSWRWSTRRRTTATCSGRARRTPHKPASSGTIGHAACCRCAPALPAKSPGFAADYCPPRSFFCFICFQAADEAAVS